MQSAILKLSALVTVVGLGLVAVVFHQRGLGKGTEAASNETGQLDSNGDSDASPPTSEGKKTPPPPKPNYAPIPGKNSSTASSKNNNLTQDDADDIRLSSTSVNDDETETQALMETRPSTTPRGIDFETASQNETPDEIQITETPNPVDQLDTESANFQTESVSSRTKGRNSTSGGGQEEFDSSAMEGVASGDTSTRPTIDDEDPFAKRKKALAAAEQNTPSDSQDQETLTPRGSPRPRLASDRNQIDSVRPTPNNRPDLFDDEDPGTARGRVQPRSPVTPAEQPVNGRVGGNRPRNDFVDQTEEISRSTTPPENFSDENGAETSSRPDNPGRARPSGLDGDEGFPSARRSAPATGRFNTQGHTSSLDNSATGLDDHVTEEEGTSITPPTRPLSAPPSRPEIGADEMDQPGETAAPPENTSRARGRSQNRPRLTDDDTIGNAPGRANPRSFKADSSADGTTQEEQPDRDPDSENLPPSNVAIPQTKPPRGTRPSTGAFDDDGMPQHRGQSPGLVPIVEPRDIRTDDQLNTEVETRNDIPSRSSPEISEDGQFPDSQPSATRPSTVPRSNRLEDVPRQIERLLPEENTSQATQTSVVSAPRLPAMSNAGTTSSLNRSRAKITIEKIAPQSAYVGQPLIYQILIRNVGNASATQVIVEDVIPSGVTMQGSIPQAEMTGSKLNWRLGNIAAGEQRKISVKVIPGAEGPVGSSATVSFISDPSSSVSAVVGNGSGIVTSDLTSESNLAKASSLESMASAQAEVDSPSATLTSDQVSMALTTPDQVNVGQSFEVRFRITNQSSRPMSDLVIREILPPSLRHESNRHDLEYRVDSIAAGSTRDVTLILTAEKTGTAISRAMLTTADNRVLQSREFAIKVGTRSALGGMQNGLILECPTAKRLLPNRPTSYAIRLRNGGSQTYSNVRVTATIPVGVSVMQAQDGAQQDPVNRTVFWNVPILQPGASQELHLSIATTAKDSRRISVVAADGNGNRTTAISDVSAANIPQFSVDVIPPSGPVQVGDQATYELRFVNRGTDPVEQITSRLTLPPELKVLQVTPMPFRQEGSDLVFDPITRLEAGKQIVVKIDCQALASGEAIVKVQYNAAHMSRGLFREESLTIGD